MSRAVWFVAGAGAGVYAVVRGRRAAEALTVDGLGDRINAAALGVRMLRDEVAHGAAEKEAELRERLAATPRALEHDADTRRRLAGTTTDTPGTTDTPREESTS